MYVDNKADKPSKPTLVSARLLDQVQERLGLMYYSVQTEMTYVDWIPWYIRWYELKHPKDMAANQ